MAWSIATNSALQAPITLTPPPSALGLASDPQTLITQAAPIPKEGALNLVGAAVRLALALAPVAGTLAVASDVAVVTPRNVTPAKPSVGAASLAGSPPSVTTTSGSASAPILLYTDIVSGSPVNGEGGAGAYLTLYGLNFGSQANMGTAAGAQVTIGGFPIANYRYLVPAKTNGQRPGFPAVFALCVQIGSAGVKGLTAGTAYAIGLTVNGVAANTVDVRGNPLNFTIQPGHFWFVDTVNGNDATGVVDDITHPFRYIQNFGGGTSGATTGIWLTGNLAAGDSIIIRGNNGTPISDQVGYQGRLMRWSSHNLVSGTAPTGALGQGYVHFTSYPGPSNGNAPEDVYIFNPPSGHGGFMGSGTATARPNAPNAGQYWSCSNMRSDTATNPGSTDASNYYLQSSGDHTRFVNLDIQWNSTSTGTAHQKAGGIAGDGDPVFIAGNYIHNVAGGDTALENHGIYMGDSNTCAHNVEICFNVIRDCTTGQGIQFHRSTATDFYFNLYIHHNYIEHTAKYGVKMDALGGLVNQWNNAISETQREGLQLDGSSINSSVNMHVENDTYWDCYHDTSGYLGAIANEGSNITGTCVISNCIIAFPAGRTNSGTNFLGSIGGMTASGNLYYDYAGILTTKPSADAAGIYANPQFVNAAAGPNEDLRLNPSSAALGIALNATINPTVDLGMNPQPRAGQTARSVGAFA